MIDQGELDATARAIVDANLYMVLGTVDRDGRPWVSPVYYATADYRRFYWISSPEVRHSRNLAGRPDISIVIFDSRVSAYTGQAVYMSAMAEELAGDDLERGLEVYPGPAERGGRPVTAAGVLPPAPTGCTARPRRSTPSCARGLRVRARSTAPPTTIAWP